MTVKCEAATSKLFLLLLLIPLASADDDDYYYANFHSSDYYDTYSDEAFGCNPATPGCLPNRMNGTYYIIAEGSEVSVVLATIEK